ncbi:MAG: response regulator [Thainema sp.]
MNEADPNLLSGLRILVVDDEPVIREFVALTLEDVGATTAIAASVPEALAYMDSFRPNVVISDLKMPGADGFTLIRAIQAQAAQTQKAGQAVVAIAMTASDSTDEQQQALATGFAEYLSKPFGQAELIEAVRRVRGKEEGL